MFFLILNKYYFFILVSALFLVISCIIFSMKMISFSHTIYDLHKVIKWIKEKKYLDNSNNEDKIKESLD